MSYITHILILDILIQSHFDVEVLMTNFASTLVIILNFREDFLNSLKVLDMSNPRNFNVSRKHL